MKCLKDFLISTAVCGAVYYFAYHQGESQGRVAGWDQCVMDLDQARQRHRGQEIYIDGKVVDYRRSLSTALEVLRLEYQPPVSAQVRQKVFQPFISDDKK